MSRCPEFEKLVRLTTGPGFDYELGQITRNGLPPFFWKRFLAILITLTKSGIDKTRYTFAKLGKCSKWVKRSMLKITMIGSWFGRPQYWSENVCIIEFWCQENEVQEHFWKRITGQNGQRVESWWTRRFGQCWIFKLFLHEKDHNYQFTKFLIIKIIFMKKCWKLKFNSLMIIGWKFEGLTLSG